MIIKGVNKNYIKCYKIHDEYKYVNKLKSEIYRWKKQ